MDRFRFRDFKLLNMFTINQIKSAHNKVKSGADFPAYIRDLKALGVIRYTTFVFDGHTEYNGADQFILSSVGMYAGLSVEETSNNDEFKIDLKAHQNGQTDYPTFCRDAAKSGVQKWVVDLLDMTCTYFDKRGEVMLVEQVPG